MQVSYELRLTESGPTEAQVDDFPRVNSTDHIESNE
jgi:hypothetical protein